MWTEFEWENKINVNTNIKDIRQYLQHILKSTNMSCLTPEHALAGDCGFLAANIYAKSIFGKSICCRANCVVCVILIICAHIRRRCVG